MKMRYEYKALMEYIRRGLLGDVRTTVMDIRMMPQRLDWTSITYRRDLNTALHVVCTTRNDYVLDYLISEGLLACLEQENIRGDRPLHVAAKHSDVYAVDRFIEVGVKVNALNKMRSSPLMMGASSRDSRAVEVLLSLLRSGGDSALVNQFGQTATHICSGLGSLESLELLLAHDKNTALVARMDGRTPLHAAAHNGRKDLLETLLKKGNLRDVNARATCGSTPVMDALRQGHVATAATFTELWPDTDMGVKDADGKGCLQVAAEGGFVESIEFLVEKFKFNPMDTDKNGECSLHSAAAAGRCDAVRLLVEQLGVPVDVTDADGKTPLWKAVQNRQKNCAELLLQLGATPLSSAVAAATSRSA